MMSKSGQFYLGSKQNKWSEIHSTIFIKEALSAILKLNHIHDIQIPEYDILILGKAFIHFLTNFLYTNPLFT